VKAIAKRAIAFTTEHVDESNRIAIAIWYIAVYKFVKHRNGVVGRGAPHNTVLNQPAQRYSDIQKRGEATLLNITVWV
jgi:hypothetical protein